MKKKFVIATLVTTVALSGVTPTFAANTGKIESSVNTSKASVQPNAIWSGPVEKALIWALRHGGSYAERLLSYVSPRAGAWLRNHMWQLADALEKLQSWEEWPIAALLMKMGCPPNDAYEIAKAIVLIIGI